MKVSLIISTYNRPDALAVCVRSVFLQQHMPDEIIIGDDGSTEETSNTIDILKKESPIPIIHLWQKDCGFRLAKMRNKCVAKASGEYIIEVDGDVMLHRHFVSDHIMMSRKGCYVKGGRTNLGKSLTQKICIARTPRHIHFWTHGIESKPENAIHCLPVARFLAPRYRKHKSSALGCNMSFFREDFIKINGYDEYFEGLGGEDGDLGRRLQQSGLTKRHLKFAGIVFHLWHEDKYMYNAEKNIAYSKRPKGQCPVRCENGVDKYL